MTEAHASFGGKDGRVWSVLSSYLIPTLMIAAYLFLMYTSETNATGKAWEAVGLVMAFGLYWLVRTLTGSAALSRAAGVGDVERVLELTRKQLVRRTSDSGKAPFYLYRALAFEFRGDWEEALAVEALARPETIRGDTRDSWRVIAATIRVAALVETGDVAGARAVLVRDVEPQAGKLDLRRHAQAVIRANLARGRVLFAERDYEAAMPMLKLVIDDVRSGNDTRAGAYFYLAKCAEALGDSDASQKFRGHAVALAPTSWIAA